MTTKGWPAPTQEQLIAALSSDYTTADLSPADRGLLTYAVRLTRAPSAITEADIAALRAGPRHPRYLCDYSLFRICQSYCGRTGRRIGGQFFLVGDVKERDMFSEIIKILITGILFLQGLTHGVAFFALIKDATRSEGQPSVPVRSWLLPSLAPRAAAWIASIFWLLATIGFIAAALSFWETLLPDDAWRQLAGASTLISTLGIALFSGIWPGAPSRRLSNIDTAAALAINAVILVLLLAGWPPGTPFDT